jgi:hypothetical protein
VKSDLEICTVHDVVQIDGILEYLSSFPGDPSSARNCTQSRVGVPRTKRRKEEMPACLIAECSPL